ncbi:MAG: uracil-DNA glycosylase [Lentisphaerae bacterium]|nr:uracil-DNA glycosylase [Lentisphaerota bacterium]
MSDDIFNQISGMIAKKSCSGVSKDAAEWLHLLQSTPQKTPLDMQISQNSAPSANVSAPQENRQMVTKQASEPASAPVFVHTPGEFTSQSTEQPAPAPINAGGIDQLRQSVYMCRRCRLAETRNNIVFGEGDPHARLMFIGEAPGADEDMQGRPFVGRAGQLLTKMISAMQFSREEVYIANVIKCRPPNNRNPEPDEAACCMPYLEEQIKLVNPECIVLLGAVATRFLLKHEGSLSKIRGTWQSYKGIPVMVTYHPSFLLRVENAKREAWIDLQQVMAKFGKFHKK